MNPLDFELLQPQYINLLNSSPQVESASDLNFSKVGDIFSNATYFGSGTMYRAWHFELPSANLGRRELHAKVSVRYNTISSLLVLIVNGEARLKCKATFDDKVMTILFKLYDHDFQLKISVKFPKLFYSFELYVNGSELADIMHQKSEVNPFQDPSIRPKNVTIPSLRTVTINKKTVVVYQIYCEVNRVEKIMVEKRFSDFVRLDSLIRGLLSSSHLKDTLPSLPEKVYNPFRDQHSFAFISTRRQKLEDYLNFCLANEKVSNLSEVLCFLGIDPISFSPLDQLPLDTGKTVDIRSFPDSSN